MRTFSKARIAFLLLGCVAIYGFWVFWSPRANVRGSFSFQDSLAIRLKVRGETFQKIRGISQQSDGTVDIMTGIVKGPLNGRGRFFRLKKTTNHWEIIESGIWQS
jgi:hypothetical protein